VSITESNIVIQPGKILLGIETLKCPVCRTENRIEVHSDLPAQDMLTCRGCSYSAILNYGPILKKYGLQPEMSRPERRDFGKHLQSDIAKI